MAHRICRETKQQPGTAAPGTAAPDKMLGWCLVSFHFLWAILSTSTVCAFDQLLFYTFLKSARGAKEKNDFPYMRVDACICRAHHNSGQTDRPTVLVLRMAHRIWK